jgi:site-specific DNA recombinase
MLRGLPNFAPLAFLAANADFVRSEISRRSFSARAIVDQDLFDAVQAKLNEQINNHRVSRTKSEALLLGRIYDDRGHKMTPSHVRKRGIKYRHYLSSALLQGQANKPELFRIPADEIEALVVKCVRGHLNGSTEIENTPLIHDHVVRVEVQSHQLVIELANPKGANPKRKRSRNVIEVPWHKTPSTRRREVLVPEAGPPQDARPIRSENRAILVASIARGRRWLDELIADAPSVSPLQADRHPCAQGEITMVGSVHRMPPPQEPQRGSQDPLLGMRRMRSMRFFRCLFTSP